MKYKAFWLFTMIFGITTAFYLFTKLKIDISDFVITIDENEDL